MKAIVAYDGNCKFCSESVKLLDKMGGRKRFQYLTLDRFFHEHPEEKKCAKEGLGFLKSEEQSLWGADAVYGALRELPFWNIPAKLYCVPGLKQIARASYSFIAKNRYVFGSCEGTCKN